MTYDNVKSHKETGSHPVAENTFFKNYSGYQTTSTSLVRVTIAPK